MNGDQIHYKSLSAKSDKINSKQKKTIDQRSLRLRDYSKTQFKIAKTSVP